MTLALVIPVWNDPDGLLKLLAQAKELEVFSQVIVVDDASDGPSMGEIDRLSFGCEFIEVRLPDQGGAGRARNEGLARVTCSHVIFFDSDDLFTLAFRDLVADLRANPTAQAADFTIFRHVDSRIREKGGYGPLESDQAFWVQAIGATAAVDQMAAPIPLTRAAALKLVRIAAYPWNKIYRTAFLRDQNIRCTELQVHNDLELHWDSFLKAENIMCSARVACEHFVHPAGSRLTNRTGKERLHVFRAFNNLHDTIEANPARLDYLEAYAEFLVKLSGWIIENLDPSYHREFRVIARQFLLNRLTSAQFTLIAVKNPALASRINSNIRNWLI